MDEPLTRLALEVNWRNLALGHDVSTLEGATFVRNTTLPDIYDANFVFNVTASETVAIDRLLNRVSREYAHASRITFRVGPFTPPPFEARLVLEGYERSEAILLLLDGSLRPPNGDFRILQIENEEGWTAYKELKRVDWRAHATEKNLDPAPAIADRLAESSRLKSSSVTNVLAYEDGRPVGHCCAWGGMDGVGQVEELFVLPEYRHRGIGTALLHHCVVRARAQGAASTVIVVDSMNTAKEMYAALGWRPLALCRQYWIDNPLMP